MAQKQHFSVRLPSDVLEQLAEQAASRGISKTGLAETYLTEAVAAAGHPGIIFRDGPAGRRAALVNGPDVWEVIETFLDEDRNAVAAAGYLSLPVGMVQTAADYYADQPEEIDGWIRRNAAMAERAEVPLKPKTPSSTTMSRSFRRERPGLIIDGSKSVDAKLRVRPKHR